MIELNAGLVIKKYGESLYSQIRRLIIANPLSGSNAASAFLKGWRFRRNNGRPEYLAYGEQPFTNEHLKKILITQLEPVVNTNTVYLYGSARKDPVCEHTSPLKNCPSCSKAIYHNTLFQFKWAKWCPLHGDELVTKCPECGRSWPKLSELLDRDCSCCGVKYSTEELGANGAFDQEVYQKTFEPYQQLIDSYIEIGDVAMIGMRPYEREKYEDYGLDDINSPDFPCLVAAFSPENKGVLEKITSIDHFYRIRKFKYATTHADRDQCEERARTWAKVVFAKVDLEVRVLMSYTSDIHHQHQMLQSYSETDCPYCLAYSIWSHLSRAKLSTSPEEGIIPKFGKELWRFNGSNTLAPRGVSPHFCLSNTKFQLQRERETGWKAPRVDVPLHISKRIYRLLLWKSFENICLFLLHRARLTNYVSTGYLIPSTLKRFMPARALPTSPWLDKVAMREPSDNYEVEMALPNDVVMAPLLVNDEARWIYSQYLAKRNKRDKYYPMYFLTKGLQTEGEYNLLRKLERGTSEPLDERWEEYLEDIAHGHYGAGRDGLKPL